MSWQKTFVHQQWTVRRNAAVCVRAVVIYTVHDASGATGRLFRRSSRPVCRRHTTLHWSHCRCHSFDVDGLLSLHSPLPLYWLSVNSDKIEATVIGTGACQRSEEFNTSVDVGRVESSSIPNCQMSWRGHTQYLTFNQHVDSICWSSYFHT